MQEEARAAQGEICPGRSPDLCEHVVGIGEHVGLLHSLLLLQLVSLCVCGRRRGGRVAVLMGKHDSWFRMGAGERGGCVLQVGKGEQLPTTTMLGQWRREECGCVWGGERGDYRCGAQLVGQNMLRMRWHSPCDVAGTIPTQADMQADGGAPQCTGVWPSRDYSSPPAGTWRNPCTPTHNTQHTHGE